MCTIAIVLYPKRCQKLGEKSTKCVVHLANFLCRTVRLVARKTAKWSGSTHDAGSATLWSISRPRKCAFLHDHMSFLLDNRCAKSQYFILCIVLCPCYVCSFSVLVDLCFQYFLSPLYCNALMYREDNTSFVLTKLLLHFCDSFPKQWVAAAATCFRRACGIHIHQMIDTQWMRICALVDVEKLRIFLRAYARASTLLMALSQKPTKECHISYAEQMLPTCKG